MNRIVLLTSFLLLSTTSHAGLYRWVDDAGKVHYSDKVPVAASKNTHSELAGNGIIKKTIDPLAEKELASEKQRKKELLALEELKQQELLLKRQKEIKQKERLDNFLLTTYEDKDELIHFFENKIKLIKGNTNILKTQSNVLAKKIEKLKFRKTRVKSEKITHSIDKKIVRIEKSIKLYKKAMADNEQELIVVSKRYKHDYQRFNDLTKK